MSKNYLSFTLEVVQHYLSSMDEQKATAKRFGINHSVVSKWTAVWKLGGEPDLLPGILPILLPFKSPLTCIYVNTGCPFAKSVQNLIFLPFPMFVSGNGYMMKED